MLWSHLLRMFNSPGYKRLLDTYICQQYFSNSKLGADFYIYLKKNQQTWFGVHYNELSR